MILLKATTEILQVTTSSTGALDFSVSYADITTLSFAPSTQEGKIVTATTTTITTAPGATTERQIKLITISNKDATVTNDVVVQKSISGTTYNLTPTIILLAGETLMYMDGVGWTHYSATGAPKGDETAAGVSTNVQYNNNGVLAGDSGLTYDTTNGILGINDAMSSLNIGVSTPGGLPNTPPSGSINIYGRTVAGRGLIGAQDQYGTSTSYQPILARNKIGYWDPQGNNVAVPGVFGFTAPTGVGTVTARNVAVTDLATRMRRLGYLGSATAGNAAGHYLPVAQFTAGSGTSDGSGFTYVCRFVPSSAAAVSGMIMFVGMSSSVAAPTATASPETLTNVIGFGQKSSDATQLYFFYGGSTAQTAVALGATNFPGMTLSTTAYEVAIYSPNSLGNTFYVQCTNISTGITYNNVVSGSATVVPQSSTLLAHRAYVSNNATALAAAIDVCSVYIETDN